MALWLSNRIDPKWRRRIARRLAFIKGRRNMASTKDMTASLLEVLISNEYANFQLFFLRRKNDDWWQPCDRMTFWPLAPRRIHRHGHEAGPCAWQTKKPLREWEKRQTNGYNMAAVQKKLISVLACRLMAARKTDFLFHGSINVNNNILNEWMTALNRYWLRKAQGMCQHWQNYFDGIQEELLSGIICTKECVIEILCPLKTDESPGIDGLRPKFGNKLAFKW